MISAELTTLLLDAGNTVVFLDMDAVAEVARSAGVRVAAEQLLAVEGTAKRRYEASLGAGGSHASGWRLYLETLLVEAGVEAGSAGRLIHPLRAAHEQLNLWRRVPADLPDALAEARAMGLRLGVVSNSEGRLEELFAHIGLGDAFEVIVDSSVEGIQKPDPEIFRRAIERMNVDAADAIYAGDIPSVDVDGAIGAGLRAALIDPFDFYPDHARAPRFASVAELVRAIRRARR